MSQSMQSWSIVIFCFNESGNVKNVIRDTIDVLKIIAPHEWELIIVDDGSTDDSIKEIEGEIKNHSAGKIKTVKHPINLGIGMALRNGYENATNENVCAVPADGQFDVKELLQYSLVPQNSFVCFYRKENLSYSLARNILSMFNKIFNALLLGVNFRDINWVKIYKTKTLKELNLKLCSSLVETEICAKLIARGDKFIEVESKYLTRNNGVSKGASWNIIKKVLMELIKVYFSVIAYKRQLKNLK